MMVELHTYEKRTKLLVDANSVTAVRFPESTELGGYHPGPAIVWVGMNLFQVSLDSALLIVKVLGVLTPREVTANEDLLTKTKAKFQENGLL